MSKSVDETVEDFFRLLLAENTVLDGSDKSLTDQGQAECSSTIARVTNQSQLEIASRKVGTGLSLGSDFAGLKVKDATTAYGLNGTLLTSVKPQVTANNDAWRYPQSSLTTPVTENRTTPELRSELQRKHQHSQFGDPVQVKPVGVLDKVALEKLLEPVFDVKNRLDTKLTTKNDATNEAIVNLKPNTTNLERAVVKQLDDSSSASVTEVLLPKELETQTGTTPPSITKNLQIQLDDEFQVLFFKVAGLTLAVPLVSLGGIVKVLHTNHIFGRPSWFFGVQTHRGTQLNIVNTCAWVMPEKYDEKLAQSINYQYLVLLEDTNWGLACESLVDAVKIKRSEVNWRTSAGKRPWLAGVVKEHMCGILNVTALVRLLDAGLGCQDPIN